MWFWTYGRTFSDNDPIKWVYSGYIQNQQPIFIGMIFKWDDWNKDKYLDNPIKGLQLLQQEVSADAISFDRSDQYDLPEDYDEAYYQQLYEQYLSMYSYYLDDSFENYNYEGYDAPGF